MPRLIKFLAVFVAMMTFGATAASAQATRTWVSGVGDDVNPCSRTAPCKTFAGAISKTAAGGEINCLDPAGYGTVTVTKSITIDCTDVFGSILASSTTGVIVNGANIVVNLRGLTINGGPPTSPGVNGVRYLQGARVNIENCVIFNFGGASPNGFGIIVNIASGDGLLQVSNSVISNNGTASSGGGVQIQPATVAPATSSIRAVFRNVVFSNNFNGIRVDSTGNGAPNGLNVTIADSTFSGGANGVVANGPAGTANVQVMLVNSEVTGNSGVGVLASGPLARIRVGNSTITSNGTGVLAGGGATINTYGNNRVNGNLTADGTFGPLIAQQ